MRRVAAWLRNTFAVRSRKTRLQIQVWLRRHPRARAWLRRSGSLDVDEYTLARGVAVGLFVGLTPTLGVQTPLMLGGAILFRANFPAAFVASCVNNPFTVAFLYVGFHELGERVMARLPFRFDDLFGGLPHRMEDLAEDGTALAIGSLCIAAPAALIGYFLFLYLWRRFDLHLPARAKKAPDAD
jgi:uncharacterized protein